MDRYAYQREMGRGNATIGRASAGGLVGLIPIIDKTDFSFDGRTSGSTQSVPLAIGVDSSLWVSGVLVVRLHTKGTWPAGSSGSATVTVESIGLVPEDPSVVFVASPAVVTSSAIVLATTAPFLDVTALTAPIGSLLQVRLLWSQGAGAGTGVHAFSISVALVGRPA